jgi:outer membrane protein
MKSLLTSLFVTGFLYISMTSYSQIQLKIGHVNYDEILQALPERDSAKAVLEKETKEMQAAFVQLTAAYNQLYDDYQKGVSSYSASVKKTKEDELIDKQRRLSEFEQNAKTTLQNRNTELVTPIIEKINKAINKVATENGFTYILDISKGSVVFVSKESQNITQLVLKILKS